MLFLIELDKLKKFATNLLFQIKLMVYWSLNLK